MRLFLLILLAALTIQLNLPANLVPISSDLTINTALVNNTLTVWIKKAGPGYASWGFGTTERADVFLIEFPDKNTTFRNCLIAGQSPPSCFINGPWVLDELIQYSNNNWAAKIERQIVNVVGVQIERGGNNVVYSSGNTTTTKYGFEGSNDKYVNGYWDIQGQSSTKGAGLLRLLSLSAALFLVFI